MHTWRPPPARACVPSRPPRPTPPDPTNGAHYVLLCFFCVRVSGGRQKPTKGVMSSGGQRAHREMGGDEGTRRSSFGDGDSTAPGGEGGNLAKGPADGVHGSHLGTTDGCVVSVSCVGVWGIEGWECGELDPPHARRVDKKATRSSTADWRQIQTECRPSGMTPSSDHSNHPVARTGPSLGDTGREKNTPKTTLGLSPHFTALQ